MANEVAKELVKDSQSVYIHIIEGDITLPNMGMSEESLQELRNQVTIVWHLAAIYDLAVPRDAAWKVNVYGHQSIVSRIAEKTSSEVFSSPMKSKSDSKSSILPNISFRGFEANFVSIL